MLTSLDEMERSETESPTKSVELSPQVKSNEQESHSETQALDVHTLHPKLASCRITETSQESFKALTPPSSPSTSASPHIRAFVAASSAVPHKVENDPAPAQKKQRLDSESMSTAAYLDHTVVPILHMALINLDRLRPADPVQYVIDYLLKNKAEYSKKISSVTSANQA